MCRFFTFIEWSRAIEIINAMLVRRGARLVSGHAGLAGRRVVSAWRCVICLGAAMTLGVADAFYALESPGDRDGGAAIAANWQNSPDAPFFRVPTMTAGIRRAQARDQFRLYCATAPESGFTAWARMLAELPDR